MTQGIVDGCVAGLQGQGSVMVIPVLKKSSPFLGLDFWILVAIRECF